MLGSTVVSRLIGRRPRTTSSLVSSLSSSSSSSWVTTQITASRVWHHNRCCSISTNTSSSESSLLVLPSTCTTDGTSTTTNNSEYYNPSPISAPLNTIRPSWRTTGTQTQFINRLYSSSSFSTLSSGLPQLASFGDINGTTEEDHSGAPTREYLSTSQTNMSDDDEYTGDALFLSVM